MSTKKIDVAVIGGSGLIGVRHCQHVAECSDTNLVAIVDPSPAAVKVSEKYNVPLYKAPDELLNSPHKPDAVIVCTPNHTHAPISIPLLRAGINVLCEKPVSHDVETAQQLVKEAAVSDGKLLIGHHRRFNPYVIQMQKILESHILGQVIAVSGLWTVPKPLDYFANANKWRQEKQRGGGVIAINLIHEIDLMLYLFGPIKRIHAEKTISVRSTDRDAVEEGAALTIRFGSGVIGTFIIADNIASPHSFEMGTGENPNIPRTGVDCYRIFGTSGTLSFPDMILSTYKDHPTWNKIPERSVVSVENVDVAPLASQLQHFASVCSGEILPNCSGQDGLDALIVCEAVKTALESSENGGTATL